MAHVMEKNTMTRDLREYARQTNARLVAAAFFFLFVVGIGLIWLIYGFGAALTGLMCLLGAMVPLALIYFAMQLLEWINKRANPDD